MRIHTDSLDIGDIEAALSRANRGVQAVYLDGCTRFGSRSRARAYEVVLRARDGRDRYGKVRTWPNSGSYGAETGEGKAATYDEWGHFLAEVFVADPEAIAGYYKSAADFEDKTRGKYKPVESIKPVGK